MGNVEGKTIGKKGYFESADELLSLRNNLSLHIREKQKAYLKNKKGIFLSEINVTGRVCLWEK